MVPDDEKDTLIFFGGKDYVSLFYELTKSMRNKKIIFYNSKQTWREFVAAPAATLSRIPDAIDDDHAAAYLALQAI